MKRPTFWRSSLMAISFSLLLSACSSPVDNPEGPVSSESASTVSTSSDQSSSSPAPTSVGVKDDPLDNGGYAEYTWDDYVAAERKMSGLTSWPEVERIRFITEEEFPTVQAQCLTEAGFPTTADEETGSHETRTVEGQEEAFALASYICNLQYPNDLRSAQAFTRTQLRVIHAYYRDQLIPCLQSRGLEISTLPSEETYVEGTASGTNPWTPYDALPAGTPDSDAMNKECPPMPPSEMLYGS